MKLWILKSGMFGLICLFGGSGKRLLFLEKRLNTNQGGGFFPKINGRWNALPPNGLRDLVDFSRKNTEERERSREILTRPSR